LAIGAAGGPARFFSSPSTSKLRIADIIGDPTRQEIQLSATATRIAATIATVLEDGKRTIGGTPFQAEGLDLVMLESGISGE
jgi:hypothetical protein